jgi:hypothetical protein
MFSKLELDKVPYKIESTPMARIKVKIQRKTEAGEKKKDPIMIKDFSGKMFEFKANTEQSVLNSRNQN